ncbi:myosin-4 [Drosophila kikkawai]|uniref:Myosin-4 n=1 Tax=Drosophila kikkawai TaxID=30033 RepID=A0A6P4IDZ5_DROKI
MPEINPSKNPTENLPPKTDQIPEIIMTQEATNYHFHPSRVQEVVQGVDRLVQATNEDLRRFRQEQAQLRENIKEVRMENYSLSRELSKYQKLMASGDYQDLSKRLKLTSEALATSKQQVEALREEQRHLRSMQTCSQRTIDNMELELKKYRAQLHESGDEATIQQYVRHIKMLEAKLSGQQQEIRTKAETIKLLHDHKQRDGEKLHKLQAQLREQNQNQDQVSSLQNQLKEYELNLEQTRQLLEESTRRESVAMRKVQEALALSEEAERGRIEAEKRAEASKEEVNQLAGSIGSVMDEAANRVDIEISQFQKRLVEKDKTIASIKEKIKKELAGHKSVVHQLEARNNQLEQRVKDVQKHNVKLEDEVDVACRRIHELERSVNEFRDEEVQHSVDKKHYESEIERYLTSYRKLKTKYRTSMDDMTQRFEEVIYKMRKQNSELLAENQMLKSGAAGDNFRP